MSSNIAEPHIAQDVLSGNASRVAPHHPSDSYGEIALSVEYTRQLLPWAMRIVCYGKERRDRGHSLNHKARIG